MPKGPILPQSPDALLEELFTIFPEYREVRRPIHEERPSFHSVLIEFSTFAEGLVHSSSEEQLCRFSRLVNAAMDSGGTLENAFATCFLEHSEQIGIWKSLRPFLSRSAIERARA